MSHKRPLSLQHTPFVSATYLFVCVYVQGTCHIPRTIFLPRSRYCPVPTALAAKLAAAGISQRGSVSNSKMGGGYGRGEREVLEEIKVVRREMEAKKGTSVCGRFTLRAPATKKV